LPIRDGSFVASGLPQVLTGTGHSFQQNPEEIKIMKKTALLTAAFAMAMLSIMVTADESFAVPSFARQTKQPCSSCHFQGTVAELYDFL